MCTHIRVHVSFSTEIIKIGVSLLLLKQKCIEVFHFDTEKTFADSAIYVKADIFQIIYKLQYDIVQQCSAISGHAIYNSSIIRCYSELCCFIFYVCSLLFPQKVAFQVLKAEYH